MFSTVRILRPTRHLTLAILLMAFGLQEPVTAQQEFTNLQFFPEDITRPELISAMRQIALGLGVRCTYCHEGEEGVPFEERDFASDAKPTKRKAREMLRMARDINERYLAHLPDRREPPVSVTCVTCHGGVPRPEVIDAVVERTLDEEGVDAAEIRYRELRRQFFGTAAYNFRDQPLIDLASRLLQRDMDAEAERILMLNLEFNPESAQSMAGLGRIHEDAGDRDGAVLWYRKSLEIQPNPQLLRRLRELGGGQ